MTIKARRSEEKADLLLATAREIIRETGDFDLPMRKLAARAQVSLRTPYELFRSKSGIIGAILKVDQKVFRDRAAELQSEDELENLFDRVRLGISFYRENPNFYRALFRATQGYSGGDETEPARENVHGFTVLTMRAIAAGLIRSETDPRLFAEILTDIFAANVRTWAASDFDMRLASLKICYGFALALAGVAPPPTDARMRVRALEFQEEVTAFETALAKEAKAAVGI